MLCGQPWIAAAAAAAVPGSGGRARWFIYVAASLRSLPFGREADEEQRARGWPAARSGALADAPAVPHASSRTGSLRRPLVSHAQRRFGAGSAARLSTESRAALRQPGNPGTRHTRFILARQAARAAAPPKHSAGTPTTPSKPQRQHEGPHPPSRALARRPTIYRRPTYRKRPF